MAGRAGRVLLAVSVVVATCAMPAGRAVAKTSVTVDGATVTLTVPVDLIGATLGVGREISGKGPDGGVITISEYWATAAKVWNDAFAKLSYKGCVNLRRRDRWRARQIPVTCLRRCRDR